MDELVISKNDEEFSDRVLGGKNSTKLAWMGTSKGVWLGDIFVARTLWIFYWLAGRRVDKGTNVWPSWIAWRIHIRTNIWSH